MKSRLRRGCGGGGGLVIKDEKLKLRQKFLITFKVRENFQELEHWKIKQLLIINVLNGEVATAVRTWS